MSDERSTRCRNQDRDQVAGGHLFSSNLMNFRYPAPAIEALLGS